ncbi:MAG: hypothetical protein M5R36_18835 [Deltaproteobacteria bacterium]|nr:hypothetical protein [Deltaproteobacteria bacterium]
MVVEVAFEIEVEFVAQVVAGGGAVLAVVRLVDPALDEVRADREFLERVMEPPILA